jgi:integrase
LARLFKTNGRDGKPSPYWYADFTTPEGQRVKRTTRCRDRAAAGRLAREWERGAEHVAADAATGIERPSEVTLYDLAHDYLAAIQHEKSARYLGSLGDALRAYVLVYFTPTREVATITRADVEGFRRAILSGAIATKSTQARRTGLPTAATANRIMVALRRMLDFGQRRGDLKENAAKFLPTLRERPLDRHRALTDEEIEGLVEALRDARHAADHIRWLRFAIATGMRDDEIAKMDWADLDLPRRVIRIQAQTAKGAITRRVPVTRPCEAVLLELPHRVGLVFGSCDRRETFQRAWKRTGLPGRCPSPHDFKHTCASRAAAAGFDLVQMMEWFGWKSPIVAQRYLHTYGSRWADMAAKMDALGA